MSASIDANVAMSMFRSIIKGVPASVHIDTIGNSSYNVQVFIGKCDNTDRVSALEVNLELFDGSKIREDFSWMHEFSFSVSVIDTSGYEETFYTQDRNVAFQYIPSESRELIMPTVCATYKALLSQIMPSMIYRVAKTRQPPEKARRKHDLITATLEREGYETTLEGTDTWQRPFWVMSRD